MRANKDEAVTIDPLALVPANEEVEPPEAANETSPNALRGSTARSFLEPRSSTQDNAKAVRLNTLGTLSTSSHKTPAPLVRKLYEYVNMWLEVLSTYVRDLSMKYCGR